ncbi:hypothetical protein [Kribbella sp. VKM Ac-2571]|nr:hypothetical protein [Kribbella sp. VKM Ac-2571]
MAIQQGRAELGVREVSTSNHQAIEIDAKSSGGLTSWRFSKAAPSSVFAK